MQFSLIMFFVNNCSGEYIMNGIEALVGSFQINYEGELLIFFFVFLYGLLLNMTGADIKYDDSFSPESLRTKKE